MKPTLGSIVIFHGAEEDRAAIVTRVHNDTCVDLRVFDDSGIMLNPEVTQGEGAGHWDFPASAAPATSQSLSTGNAT